MATARELLDDLRNTKRASCMSEYTSWINEVVEYLEQEDRNERSRGEDPTIAGQMELTLDVPPSIRDGYE